jgi:hypothetical protein
MKKMRKQEKGPHKGIDDALNNGATIKVFAGEDAAEEVDAICAAAGVGPDRPKIVISTEEHLVNEQAIAALASDELIYQRYGSLVRVLEDSSPADKGIRRPFAPRTDPLPAAVLRSRLSKAAQWFKLKLRNEPGSKVPAHPPDWCVSAVHAYGAWEGIRHLEAVVDHPVLKPDGTILEEPGYDVDSGLLLIPAGGLPTLPESPDRDDAVAAAQLLLSLMRDFPFLALVHQAAWLAGLLTPFARFAFSGPAPLFLVDANVRGAGKGLSLNVIGRTLNGKDLTVATYTNEEEELRKRITSLAISGERLILFDNVSKTFGNATLDAALTATIWKDRKLGVNRMVECPLYATWYATGNNVSLGADTARRICHIRIESPMERPELREDFRHKDLLAYVRKNRRRLLGAALTILRAHCLAGKPDMGLPAWGSFEGWSALVRSAVVWAGLPDPGETRIQLQERSDVTAEYMRVLLQLWQHLDEKGQGMTAAEVISRLYEAQQDIKVSGLGIMREAIESLCPRPDTRSLGNLLRKHRRRIYGGLYIDLDGNRNNAGKWVVLPASAFCGEDRRSD